MDLQVLPGHISYFVYASMVQGLAIDLRNYSGNESVIEIIHKKHDHQIKFGTTPDDCNRAGVPYASSETGKVIYNGISLFDIS